MTESNSADRRGSSRLLKLLAAAAVGLLLAPFLQDCKSAPADSDALGESGRTDLLTGDEGLLLDAESMATAFGLARAVLYDEPAPEPGAFADAPGRRAFVCAYSQKGLRACGTSTGEDLAESIGAAAEELKQKAGRKLDPADRGDVRLKIDIVSKVEPETFRGAVERPKVRNIATYGYWIENEGKVGWLLPSEVLELGVYSSSKKFKGNVRERLLKALRPRTSLGALPEEFPYTRLYTVAWVEKDGGGKPDRPGIFRVYRVHDIEPLPATEETLVQSTVWAADYLISSVSTDGEIRYTYRPASDRDGGGYNVLRHGGTTYSILQAYDRTKFEPYLVAARAAMEWLMRERSFWDEREGPFGGGKVFYVHSRAEGPTIKLGGAGLALVMIDQYVESTGDVERYRKEAEGYARFIVSQQTETGEFVYHAGLTKEDPPKMKPSPYYPGEAILGLIRMYSWDRNPLWLETAVRGADWLIDVRDKGKTERSLANDHWLMIALSYLYQYTRDDKYVTHSLNLARAVEFQYRKRESAWDTYPDYQGGYYDPPRSTPAATRGEGMVAVLDTCALAKLTDCGWIQAILEDTAQHELYSQYSPDQSWWVRNQAKTLGGFNGGLVDTNIRNDFVQHNMSVMIGFERHLAAARGVALPGGPAWTERNLAGETYPGLSEEDVAQLRAATLRIRGETHWEKVWAKLKAESGPEEGGEEVDPTP